jgi:hypothetical protein
MCVVIVALGSSHSSVILCKDIMLLSNKATRDVGKEYVAKRTHL